MRLGDMIDDSRPLFSPFVLKLETSSSPWQIRKTPHILSIPKKPITLLELEPAIEKPQPQSRRLVAVRHASSS